MNTAFMKLKERAKTVSRNKKQKQFYTYCTREAKILDVGVHPDGENHNKNISVNHFLNSFKFRPQFYTGLGIEQMDTLKQKYPEFEFIRYAGNIFPFEDKQFEWAYSNAVIEHVGSYQKKLVFLKEMLRVSENVFFTTPNKFFPIDSHTGTFLLHWFKPLFNSWRVRHHSWMPLDTLNLLSKKEIICLLRDAKVKSYKLFSNRYAGLTMTYTVVATHNINV